MLRIRRGMDGCYWIPRYDKETIDYLDGIAIRMPGELKWMPKAQSIDASFSNVHLGQFAYIIGKGPSLDLLTKAAFDQEGPVFAINESIHKIEQIFTDDKRPIYCVQLDQNLEESCRPQFKTTKILTGPHCANLYNEGVYKIQFDPRTFGLYDGCITAQFAIMLARYFGCSHVSMISFDGCTNNDFDYADCIGYDSGRGGIKTRFASHKQLILQTAKNIPLTWVTPEEKRILKTDAV